MGRRPTAYVAHHERARRVSHTRGDLHRRANGQRKAYAVATTELRRRYLDEYHELRSRLGCDRAIVELRRAHYAELVDLYEAAKLAAGVADPLPRPRPYKLTP